MGRMYGKVNWHRSYLCIRSLNMPENCVMLNNQSLHQDCTLNSPGNVLNDVEQV